MSVADVFGQMHAAACAGDQEKFYTHVAESRLLEHLAKRAGGGAEGQAGSKARLDLWRKDIKEKAKHCTICGWAFVGSEEVGDSVRVEVHSKCGEKRFLYFGEIGGQLKLTDYENDDATEPAPPLSAMAICNKIVSKGGATRCFRSDGGDSVSFAVNGHKAKDGIVAVFSPSRYRCALDDDWTSGGYSLATSDALGALVIWRSGGELVDTEIRTGLLEAETMDR